MRSTGCSQPDVKWGPATGTPRSYLGVARRRDAVDCGILQRAIGRHAALWRHFGAVRSIDLARGDRAHILLAMSGEAEPGEARMLRTTSPAGKSPVCWPAT